MKCERGWRTGDLGLLRLPDARVDECRSIDFFDRDDEHSSCACELHSRTRDTFERKASRIGNAYRYAQIDEYKLLLAIELDAHCVRTERENSIEPNQPGVIPTKGATYLRSIMQKHWEDEYFDEHTSRQAPQESEHSCGDSPTSCSPPPEFEDEGSIPFLKLRGRWLREMGFNAGSKLQIDAEDGVITLTILGRPKLPRAGVPRRIERQIHHTMVEADRLPICPNGSLL